MSLAVSLVQPSKVRWWIIVLSCAASFLLYVHRYSWGVIKPSLKKENPSLTDTQLGWLDSAFNATYAIGQVPTGLAADLIGPRAVLAGSALLWTGMVAVTALVYGFWALIAVRAVFGLAQASCYPVLGQLTRSWVPAGVRTGVQGAVGAFGRFGGAAASLLVATLLISWLGMSWRDALLWVSLPGFLLAAAIWVLVRRTPEQHPWCNPAEVALLEEPQPHRTEAATVAPARPINPGSPHIRAVHTNISEVPPPGEPEAAAGAPPVAQPRLVRGRLVSFAILLVFIFMSTFADNLYVFWIPQYLVEGKGLDTQTMGLFASLPLLGGAAGGVVGGLLNDLVIRRTGNRRWSRAGVALTGKLMAGVLIALSLLVPDGRLAMVVLLVCKFFGDWSQPTIWGTITDIGGKALATVFAVVNTMGIIGAFVAGPVMGALVQHLGWEGLFLSVAGIYVLAALCWLFIDCTRQLVA